MFIVISDRPFTQRSLCRFFAAVIILFLFLQFILLREHLLSIKYFSTSFNALENPKSCFYASSSIPLSLTCKSNSPHDEPAMSRCICENEQAVRKLLPSFFIIGSQKSGSTALIGYFLFHPKFIPQRRKEGHLFDFAFQRKPKFAFVWYSALPDVPKDESMFSGECTPSYILNRNTAKLLYAHAPEARLIAIIRDPVERSLSEYNMKVRRVNAEMRPDDPSTQEALLGAVQGCVTLSQMSGNKQHNFDEKMSSCLFSRLKHVPGFLATVPNYRSSPKMMACLIKHIADMKSQWSLTLTIKQKILCCFDSKHVFYEHVQPLETAFENEMNKVDASMQLIPDISIPPESACSGATLSRTVYTEDHENLYTLPEACLRDEASASFLYFDMNRFWPSGSTSNIVKDFVFRSIYVDQLLNYKSVLGADMNNLLVITNEALRNNPNGTFNLVLKHVGREALDVSKISMTQLHEAINQAWPSFEKTSGWQFETDTDSYHLHAAMKLKLCYFFRMHNARLTLHFPKLAISAKIWSKCGDK